MKHWIKRLTALALAGAMLLALTGCGFVSKRQIKTTVSHLESAVQEADVQGILDCLDPDQAKVVEAGLNLVGLFSGGDGVEAAGSAITLIFGIADSDGSVLSSFKIEVKDIQLSDGTATAECEISFDLNGEKQTFQYLFSFVQVDSKELPWRISSFQRIKG